LGDKTDLELGKEFDFVTCLFSSMGIPPCADDPGGLLPYQTIDPTGRGLIPRGPTLEAPSPGILCGVR
jgi:hypothetical protein